MQGPAPRPMRADARRNRVRILEAARELFGRAQHDVQMEEIARQAELGVGTIYRHFPDKEALMGELVRERFCLFNDCMRAALAEPAADPFEALAQTMRVNAASVAEDAATRFAFMSGDERVFAVAQAEMEQYMELAEALVARARAAGALHAEFAASDIPMIMCGVCATIDRKAGWDWRRHLELVLAGMRAPGATRPSTG